MTENNNLNIKKVHKGLIDSQGRRKYFRLLKPKLLETPFEIDIKSITERKKILFLIPNFHWIDEDVNALWDLLPWNLCQIAAMVEDICATVRTQKTGVLKACPTVNSTSSSSEVLLSETPETGSRSCELGISPSG